MGANKERKLAIEKILIIILLGLCLYNIAFVLYFDKKYNEEFNVYTSIEILDLKEDTKYYYKYTARFKNRDKIIVYLKKKEIYYPGDVLKIDGVFYKPDKPSNYKEFNYRDYLKTKKIYGIVKAENVERIETKKDIYFFIGKIKRYFTQKIEKQCGSNTEEFLKGILLGNTSEINDDIKDNFRKSSVSHILAISGLHVSYLLTSLKIFLSKIIKSKKKQNLLLITFLIFFTIFTGCSPSCIRTCIMNILIIFSEFVYRKNNFYVSFIVSFFILILINPFNLLSIGMYLSYFGTLRNSTF